MGLSSPFQDDTCDNHDITREYRCSLFIALYRSLSLVITRYRSSHQSQLAFLIQALSRLLRTRRSIVFLPSSSKISPLLVRLQCPRQVVRRRNQRHMRKPLHGIPESVKIDNRN